MYVSVFPSFLSLCHSVFLLVSFSLLCTEYSANMSQIFADILRAHVYLYQVFIKSSSSF